MLATELNSAKGTQGPGGGVNYFYNIHKYIIAPVSVHVNRYGLSYNFLTVKGKSLSLEPKECWTVFIKLFPWVCKGSKFDPFPSVTRVLGLVCRLA